MATDPLKVKGFNFLAVPVTASHTIDDESPLHGADIDNLGGTIWLDVRAHDVALGSPVSTLGLFTNHEIVRGRFADIVHKTWSDIHSKDGANL